jgi:protein phosphatase
MGGALAGEVASELAVSSVSEMMLRFRNDPNFSGFAFQERLRLAIEQANLLINKESQKNAGYTGMGATFTAAGIVGDTAYMAQVGDSRCYLIRQDKIAQITEDQSLIFQLVKAGHITEEEAEVHNMRNVILQALGAHSSINVAVNRIKLRRGDILLLCSDGLSGKVKGQEMLQIVGQNPDLKVASDLLINLANERGGEDNITVIVARFDGEGLRETTPQDPFEGEFLPRDPNLPDDLDLTDLSLPNTGHLVRKCNGVERKPQRHKEHKD